MMRLCKLIVAGLTVFSFASAASAVEVTVSVPALTVTAGDSLTINIQLHNADLTAVTGITGFLSGLNAVGGVVTSGQASQLNFAAFCGAPFPAATPACFGALPTLTNDNYDPNDLTAFGLPGLAAYSPGDDVVTLIAGLHGPGTTSPNAGDFDPGLGGVVGVFDPIDITITISTALAGVINLGIDLDFAVDGGGTGTASTAVALTVLPIPEPGTALLMGLGLAGLGVAGRRK